MSHQHQPLPNDGRYIRLATVQPGVVEYTVVVDLDIVPFTPQSNPRYEALSYVWGKPDDPETAHMRSRGSFSGSSRTLSVTRNLAVALRHLRQRDELRVLWIDAICID